MIAYLASSLNICVTADVSIHRLLGTGFDTSVTSPACETVSSVMFSRRIQDAIEIARHTTEVAA
jgi:hypothetical protein